MVIFVFGERNKKTTDSVINDLNQEIRKKKNQ
jgi:hypothetical protein